MTNFKASSQQNSQELNFAQGREDDPRDIKISTREDEDTEAIVDLDHIETENDSDTEMNFAQGGETRPLLFNKDAFAKASAQTITTAGNTARAKLR